MRVVILALSLIRRYKYFIFINQMGKAVPDAQKAGIYIN